MPRLTSHSTFKSATSFSSRFRNVMKHQKPFLVQQTIQHLTKIDHVDKKLFHTFANQLAINQQYSSLQGEESESVKEERYTDDWKRKLLVLSGIFAVCIGVEEYLYYNLDESAKTLLEREDFQHIVNSELVNYDDPSLQQLLPMMSCVLRKGDYLEMYQEQFIRNLFHLAAFSSSLVVKRNVISIIRGVFENGSPRLAQSYYEYSFTDPKFSLINLLVISEDFDATTLFTTLYNNKYLKNFKNGGIINDKVFQYHVLNYLSNGNQSQKECVIACLAQVLVYHMKHEKQYESPSIVFRNKVSRLINAIPQNLEVPFGEPTPAHIIRHQQILIVKGSLDIINLSDSLKDIKEEISEMKGFSDEESNTFNKVSNNEKSESLKGKSLLVSSIVASLFLTAIRNEMKRWKVIPVSAFAFAYCIYALEYRKKLDEHLLDRFHNSNSQLSNSEYYSNYKKFETQTRIFSNILRYACWTGGLIVSPWVTLVSSIFVDFREDSDFYFSRT